LAFLEDCIDRSTAIAAACGWMAFGGGIEATVGLVVGAAGLATAVAGIARRHGAESERALAAIRRRVAADLSRAAQSDSWETSAEIEIADEALARALSGCFLDRAALAASARHPDGFPEAATRIVLAALARREPLAFGADAAPVARRYAETVIRAALRAAVENEAYFKALEPHLLFEMLEGIGTVERQLADIDGKVVAIGDGLRLTHGEIVRIRELAEKIYERDNQVPTAIGAFKAHASDGAGATFSLAESNSIIVGWTAAPDDWWERVGGALNAALDRLSAAGSLVPQRWQFPRSGELPDALWRPLSVPDSTHTASIVHIGDPSGPYLAIDERFEGRLAKRGYLAERVGAHGFMDARHLDGEQRRAMVAGGAIPLTAETRLIAETMLAEKPLMVWDGSSAPKPASVEALLAWLRDRKVPVLDGARLAEGDDSWALGLVANIFGIRGDQVPNPYRKLDHYSPGDAGNYRGREADAAIALAWLREALQREGPASLRIGGSSGVGKSSFLNARLAPMARDHGLTYVTFRPTDFEASPNAVFSPIRDFCRTVKDALGKSAGLEEHPLIRAPDYDRARGAAVAWLGSLRKAGIRLLIGVDQFEEILDNIHNDWNGAAWRSLLDLFAELPDAAGTLLAVTLETSREPLLAQAFKQTLFARSKVIALRDGDERFLRQVITEPFAAVGLKLGEDIIAALIAETHRHQDEIGSGSSALPLLSLKLYGLFAHLSQQRALRAGTISGSFGGASSEVTLAELNGLSLSIAEEIASLADQAWAETGGGTPDDLDQFIRPYVRIIPTDNGASSRIVLQAVPQRGFYSMASRQSAFIRRRLIVPTATGFRLVHESVIRRWRMTAAWLEQEHESLLRQTALANTALHWRASGRPALDRPGADDIALAARFLNALVIDWFDADDLPEAAAIEREYYLALFSHADNPRTEVPASPRGTTYIHLAASYGLLDLLERFLRKDAEAVNLERRGDRRTPLMGAAWRSAPAVAKLLEWGADPNAVEDGGFMPLDAAIWGGNQAVFDLLLPLTDPGLAAIRQSNPLYGAVNRNRPDMVERLETRGFRHDTRGRNGVTPLMGAAYGSSVQMFEYCLGRGDVLARDADGDNVFDIAAMRGMLEFQQILIAHPQGLEALAPRPETGRTALMLASGAQMSKTVRFLLQAGIDPNARIVGGENEGQTALHFCLDWVSRWADRAPRYVVEKTRATLQALLASDSIDVNLASRSGERAYAMLAHHEELRALIAAHPSFDSSSLPATVATPLERAIAAKNRELVIELLQDPRHRRVADRVDASGATPSSAMLENGMGDLVMALIESGIVAPWHDAPRYKGLLSLALKADDKRLVRLLVDRMPQPLTRGQLETLVVCKIRFGTSRDFDQDDAVFDRALAAIPDGSDLAPALLQAGMLGSTALAVRLIEAGAAFRETDEWERTILDRGADSVRTSPAVEEAIRHGRVRHWTAAERNIFAMGRLDQIRSLLASEPQRALVDGWGRYPADLVPDAARDEVASMTDISKDAQQ
jgi:ankyrin repeat protein